MDKASPWLPMRTVTAEADMAVNVKAIVATRWVSLNVMESPEEMKSLK
jgi:hypothetical protein